uniref:NR LBD domain-containing protein n=1 Tax=Panagrellus redivivus TaxID=6233 RepID=A0A7E4UMU8_PANRE
MKRCIEIGMRIDADTENDSASTSNYTDSPKDPIMDQFNGSPISMDGNKVNYDPKPLLNVIKENIVKDNTQSMKGTPGVVLSPLQRMSYELTKFLSHRSPDPSNIVVSFEVGVPDNIRFHEDFILRLVRVVTASESFVKIENSQKFEIFRHFWVTFLCVERTYHSITVFGPDETDMRLLLNNMRAIDLGPIFRMHRDNETEQVKLTRPMVERTFRHIVAPMKALQLTIYEISFLALNLLWSLYDVNGITAETHKAAEEILERNSAEMHSYYVYEMKLPNYAARLAAITRLVPAIEALLRCKKDLVIMGKFFDFFEVDFFDCGLLD